MSTWKNAATLAVSARASIKHDSLSSTNASLFFLLPRSNTAPFTHSCTHHPCRSPTSVVTTLSNKPLGRKPSKLKRQVRRSSVSRYSDVSGGSGTTGSSTDVTVHGTRYRAMLPPFDPRPFASVDSVSDWPILPWLPPASMTLSPSARLAGGKFANRPSLIMSCVKNAWFAFSPSQRRWSNGAEATPLVSSSLQSPPDLIRIACRSRRKRWSLKSRTTYVTLSMIHCGFKMTLCFRNETPSK